MFCQNVFILVIHFSTLHCVESFDFVKVIGDLGRSFGIHTSEKPRQKEIGEPPVYVTGKWIKGPNLDNNQIYLFSKDVKSMTWFEADAYCGRQGAFLAEAFSKEESDFLKNQANRLPETNWWIGLRQFEKCQCTSIEKSNTIIIAFIDPDSLQRRDNNGLGRTSCPYDYEKYCNGMEWRWGLSGHQLSYTYWNTQTEEPNDKQNEHCVTMWFKSDNQRWGNWRCSVDKDGDGEQSVDFKPVCQKEEDNNDYLFE